MGASQALQIVASGSLTSVQEAHARDPERLLERGQAQRGQNFSPLDSVMKVQTGHWVALICSFVEGERLASTRDLRHSPKPELGDCSSTTKPSDVATPKALGLFRSGYSQAAHVTGIAIPDGEPELLMNVHLEQTNTSGSSEDGGSGSSLLVKSVTMRMPSVIEKHLGLSTLSKGLLTKHVQHSSSPLHDLFKILRSHQGAQTGMGRMDPV